MWSFDIMFKEDNAIDMIIGRDLADACKRRGIDQNDIVVLLADYLD